MRLPVEAVVVCLLLDVTSHAARIDNLTPRSPLVHAKWNAHPPCTYAHSCRGAGRVVRVVVVVIIIGVTSICAASLGKPAPYTLCHWSSENFEFAFVQLMQCLCFRMFVENTPCLKSYPMFVACSLKTDPV